MMIASVDIAHDGALEALYREHYVALVRLAALLLGDVGVAEEVVQDSFVRLHGSWSKITAQEKRVSYLRSIVLNGARNRARRRTRSMRLEVVGLKPSEPAEARALQAETRREVMEALRRLPARQRECTVLRFYLDFSEAEIAETLGISAGSVKTHTHRAMRALESLLEPTNEN